MIKCIVNCDANQFNVICSKALIICFEYLLFCLNVHKNTSHLQKFGVKNLNQLKI